MKPDSANPGRIYIPADGERTRKLSSPDDFTWVPWNPGWIATGAILLGLLIALYAGVAFGTLKATAIGGIGTALVVAAFGYVLDVFVATVDWRTRQRRWRLRMERMRAKEMAKESRPGGSCRYHKFPPVI